MEHQDPIGLYLPLVARDVVWTQFMRMFPDAIQELDALRSEVNEPTISLDELRRRRAEVGRDWTIAGEALVRATIKAAGLAEGGNNLTPLERLAASVIEAPSTTAQETYGSAFQGWAERWHLSTPWVVAKARLRAIDRALDQERPSKRKEGRSDYEGLWPPAYFAALERLIERRNTPTVEASELVQQWGNIERAAAARPAAQPAMETESEFLARCREHYRARERLLSALAGTKPRSLKEIEQHAVWLLRIQVGRESIAAVGIDHRKEANTVRGAVRRLAELLPITLRAFSRGRQAGRKESASRRRVAGSGRR
jgi:hypothetical protein